MAFLRYLVNQLLATVGLLIVLSGTGLHFCLYPMVWLVVKWTDLGRQLLEEANRIEP